MPDIEQLAFFFLVLVRIIAFFISGPFFSLSNIPATVKIGLSFMIALTIFPLVGPEHGVSPLDDWAYIFALVRETLVGLVIGYTSGLLLTALVYAGSLMDIHIGFFMSQIFDPLSGSMAGILSRFMYLFGMAAMLAINGHHLIIAALVQSFTIVPLNTAQVTGTTALFMIKVFAQVLTIGVQIAAPLLAVMLIIDVTMGLIARTAPQINVFMLGFPVKIIAGLITLSVMVPILVRIIYSICNIIVNDITFLMKGLT